MLFFRQKSMYLRVMRRDRKTTFSRTRVIYNINAYEKDAYYLLWKCQNQQYLKTSGDIDASFLLSPLLVCYTYEIYYISKRF